MAGSLLALVALGCDQGSTIRPDDGRSSPPVDAGSEATSLDATAAPEANEGAQPGALDAAWLDSGGSLSDQGRVDASGPSPITGDAAAGDHPPTRSNFTDAGCPIHETWIFPDEGHSSYCGTIGDACQFVCGTMSGCVVDVVVNTLQQVHCPLDAGHPP